MMIAELVRLLARFPASTIVKVFSEEAGELMPVTDAVYGSEIVELTTDEEGSEDEEDEEDS